MMDAEPVRKILIIKTLIIKTLIILAVACLAASAASADKTTLPPLLCGEDEREDAPVPCLQESAFIAGVPSAALNLMAGGNSWGCDSEWAVGIEFALDWLPPGHPVQSASLIVRKTGYSDDSQGFFYLGAFAYPADGQAVAVERGSLTPETALDVTYPPAANVDLEFAVTGAVQAAVAAGHDRVGLLLAGVYSEVGYEDWISIGGTDHANPPRLVVTFEGPVQAVPISWSALKALHYGP